MIWETIQHITTPLALAAFIAALITVIVKRKLVQKKELISEAPPEDRASLIEATFETYHIKDDNLTPDQKFLLVQQVLSQKIQRQKLQSITAIILALIMSGTALAAYSMSKNRGEDNSEGHTVAVTGNDKYAFVSGSSNLGPLYDLVREFDQLDNNFDESLQSKTYSALLSHSFEELITKSKNEYQRLLSLEANVPLNRLIYIQGTLIGGSNFRLALLNEFKHNNERNIVRYARIATENLDTAFRLINSTDLLSASSKAQLNQWLTEENHIDRYNYLKFYSEALVYRYDSTQSGVSKAELLNDFEKVNPDFLSTYSLTDSIKYPTIKWLQVNHIIPELQ